ncbi:MAG: ankyrin repeat domain-containing protein [Burkholderiales bacterium]|nr:ankyrin repeat domain-containing protein [Burkholderiales bacterium]
MTVQRLCADEVQGLMQKENLLLLDTRDRASFDKGHIPSAMHASTAEIENLLMRIPKGTPILIYCYHGNASLVHGQMFVDFGFMEVYSLNGGYEGWMLARKEAGKSRLQSWLDEQGFSGIDSLIDGGITPLMHAARHGDASITAELLMSGANAAPRNSDGNQALWFACYSGNLAIMDLLLSAGCAVDNMNDNGSTCLMYAASSGKDSVVEKLLEAGADIGLANLDDYTALDMASSLGALELLRGRKVFS